jgi:hypothetical protein
LRKKGRKLAAFKFDVDFPESFDFGKVDVGSLKICIAKEAKLNMFL